MTGDEFARFLATLPAEERALPVATLVDLYDGPVCVDCGRRHPDVWSALACDGLADAARRVARRRAARFRAGRERRR